MYQSIRHHTRRFNSSHDCVVISSSSPIFHGPSRDEEHLREEVEEPSVNLNVNIDTVSYKSIERHKNGENETLISSNTNPIPSLGTTGV